MRLIKEAQKEIPVVCKADICVVGGSTTGVFAAIRAARLGAKVVIIEKQNCFGGMSTAAMINIWHPILDAEFKKQIIGGLTTETIERLKKRDAIKIIEKNIVKGFLLNTEELKIELDEMVIGENIKPYLCTMFTAPFTSDGELKGVFIENKSGRGAILAKTFIDATGDADLCYRLGLPYYINENMQPPTTLAKIYGLESHDYKSFNDLLRKYGDIYKLTGSWGWSAEIPGIEETGIYAKTRIFEADCSDAESLTRAEIEGRRQVRAIMDIFRKYGDITKKPVLLALGSSIGIRETRHVKCQYQIKEDDILFGKRFDDAIINGSYPVDIHNNKGPEISFKYLDGTEKINSAGYKIEMTRWREDTGNNPTFWQIPFRCLVPKNCKYGNIVTCGRSIDADMGAFGAARVMVSTNQAGEAAGVAAWLGIDSGKSIGEIDTNKLRKTLSDGGSIII